MVVCIFIFGSIMVLLILWKIVVVGNNEVCVILILFIWSWLIVLDFLSVGLIEIWLFLWYDVVFIRVRIEKNVMVISGMMYVKRFEKSGKVLVDRM